MRSSLFFIPLAAVGLAIVLAVVGIGIDRHIDEQGDVLPLGLSSTVESARALLSTIAGATITFAAIAFSVSLLVIQQASSQYSPRVVHTLFRDPFNKRVMGLVVGTFTYCVIVLRSVRTAIEKSGDPVIPNLSVAIAVALGIATILAIVGFINHSAHSMDVSKILQTVQDDALDQIQRRWTVSAPGSVLAEPAGAPTEPASTVRFRSTGWVQQIDYDAILRCAPEGATVWLATAPGRYGIAGTPMCMLSVVSGGEDEVARRMVAAVSMGDTRTMQQDVSFGLRQLADVALKALSPGINDPTTAQDAIFHAAAVLASILVRDPPSARRTAEAGRELILTQQPTHRELVALTFDEVRRAATNQPTVCVYLLESLELLSEVVHAAGLPSRFEPLAEQARLVLEGAMAADLLPADRRQVQQAYDKRFGS